MGYVLVLGDVMLDTYEVVGILGTSQEAPVFKTVSLNRIHQLGGAGNAARNCKALGSDVSLVGFVGSDSAASILEDHCEMEGILHNFIPSAQTTVKHRFVTEKHEHLFRVDREEIIPWSGPYPFNDHLKVFDTLFVSDYGKGVITEEVYNLIRRAKEQGLFVVVNGKPQSVIPCRQADVLVLNQSEAEQTVTEIFSKPVPRGRPDDGADYQRQLTRLLFDAIYSCSFTTLSHLVVTFGEYGMMHHSADDQNWIAACNVRTADIIGAGDTVSATIANAGRFGVDVLYEANINAASVVTKYGTAVP